MGRVTDTDWDGRRATVVVDEVWRGDVDSPAVVVGTPGSRSVFSSVDRTYTWGETYLFLPWGRAQGQWQDNNCSNTQVYGVELDRYRPGGAVRVAATPSPSQLLTAAGRASSPGERSDAVGSRTAGAAAVLAGAAVMAGTTWLAVQRRRRRRAGPSSVRRST